MKEKSSPAAFGQQWPPRRVRPLAMTLSLGFHLLVLLALGREYHLSVARLPPRPHTHGELTFVEVGPDRIVSTPPAPPPLPPTRANASRERDDPADAPASAAAAAAEVRRAAAAADPLPEPAGASAGRALSGSVLSDPRLFSDPLLRRGLSTTSRPASASSSLHARFETARRAEDAAIATADSVARRGREIELFGRRIAVFGDSAAAAARDLSLVVAGERMVLPTDGREWENRELRRQSADFVRDSILRERNRARRPHPDAERRRRERPRPHQRP